MRRLWCLGVVGLMLTVGVPTTGCFYLRVDVEGLTEQDVARLRPGITTLKEVLDAFGPPEAIIDGRQQLVDFDALQHQQQTPTAIPTRALAAPEGTVILVYLGRRRGAVAAAGAQGLPLDYMGVSTRGSEVFVFVSKNDKRVVATAGPRPG